MGDDDEEMMKMEMRKKMEMKKKMRRKISNPRLLPFFGYCRCIFLMQHLFFFHACLIWSFCNSHFFEPAAPILSPNFFLALLCLISKVERVIYSFCCVISLHLRRSFVAFIC